MNSAQMIDRVYERAGIPTTDPQFPRAVVLSHLNDALRTYQSLPFPWPWLEKTSTVALVASTATYDPFALSSEPVAVRRAIRVSASGTDVRELVAVSDADRAMWDDTTGDPVAYSLDWDETAGATIRLYPTPGTSGGSVVLDYTTTEADMIDSAGSAPKLPVRLRDVLVDHAVNRVLAAKLDVARAQTFATADAAVSQAKLRRTAAAMRGAPVIRATAWG